MKVAICYRGHYIRNYIRVTNKANLHFNINFFNNLQNHKNKLYNFFEDVDIFFHTYESSDKNEDLRLVDELKPKKYIFDKIAKPNVYDSILDSSRLVIADDYDFIINLRFDLVFLKEIRDFYIDFDKFNFLFRDHEKPWLRDKKTSDLIYTFNSRYKEVFEKSIPEQVGKGDKMGSGHYLYNSLLNNNVSESEINFMVSGYHTSWVEKNESKNRFISLNRGFHTDL